MTSELKGLADFWNSQHRCGGKWMHPDDDSTLRRHSHPFVLDQPAVPFVGDLLHAPVIVLGANGGYSKETPLAFTTESATQDCLRQIGDGSTVRWAAGISYYQEVNYGWLLRDRRLVVVNACAYRSPSSPPARLIGDLNSVWQTRIWLMKALLPLVLNRQRLVIAWRPGLWGDECKGALKDFGGQGVVYSNPRSSHLNRAALAEAERFSRRQS